ncbi:hypothetical protein BJV74DRAFT_851723 [Russula compacta]|nr:hypothetical protein BJV74DRAFT_851723 [Russula compacta]
MLCMNLPSSLKVNIKYRRARPRQHRTDAASGEPCATFMPARADAGSTAAWAPPSLGTLLSLLKRRATVGAPNGPLSASQYSISSPLPKSQISFGLSFTFLFSA